MSLPVIGDRVLVTLRSPMVVVLQDRTNWVRVIDGVLMETSEQVVTFRAQRLFVAPRHPKANADDLVVVTMAARIAVTIHNIAALLMQTKPEAQGGTR